MASKYGIREAPVCTDCHGEHRILSPLERGSPIFATNIPKMVCGRCHDDLRLTEKYGMSADKVSAYEDSYHGLAGRAGKATVASCASCHGVHDTLPSSDPRSHVHVDNLAATCGKPVIPAPVRNSRSDSVHTLPTQKEFPARLLHADGLPVADLPHDRRYGRAQPARPAIARPRSPAPTAYAVPTRLRPEQPRMLLGFRVAHALLGSSFIVLGYTGFALKYPEAWWAKPFVLWENGRGRPGGAASRAAAVAMLARPRRFHLVHVVMEQAGPGLHRQDAPRHGKTSKRSVERF